MNIITEKSKMLLANYSHYFNKINQISQGRNFPGIELLISDYSKILNVIEADEFFNKYGVGNNVFKADFPFERQFAYELLLEVLKSLDPGQYQKIHKGSPYYFISWTSYQYQNFAKAIFYMDAAVSEDLKIPEVQNMSQSRPAIDFFLLKSNTVATGLVTHLDLRNVFQSTFQNYHHNGGGVISIDHFCEKFVNPFLYNGPERRSLLTALYTFILQYDEKSKQIQLRSATGGSIQPFLDHLFDGARILESLLEAKGVGGTLRPKITNSPELMVTQSVLKKDQTLADAEQEFNLLTANGNSFQDCNFSSSYIIRNTTGHSLLWPDQFSSNDSYSILYHTLVNSIFWTIEKQWL